MGSISWFGLGTVACVDKNINPNKYTDILKDNLWPVVAKHFPGGGYIFQDDYAPVHRARSTVEYKTLHNIKIRKKSFSWPAQ